MNLPELNRSFHARRVLTSWHPDDPDAWSAFGRRVAHRNLVISVVSLFVAFCVWTQFSAVIVFLPAIGFHFDTAQLFWLAALPSLSGATLRLFYSFAISAMGGRRGTMITTLSLLIPSLWLGLAIQDTTTPYSHFVGIAILCGLGGGNFASSMVNISFFYPKGKLGFALGINAGVGNLGVSGAQFLVPLVVHIAMFGAMGGQPQHLSDGQRLFVQNAGFIWVPLILICAALSRWGMNDVASARSSVAEQLAVLRNKHNWLACCLYIGTFGSFIGFSAAFPMLIKTQFPGANPLAYAFVGPLVGGLARSVGGALADRWGGARMTFYAFALMAVCLACVLRCLPGEARAGVFSGFLASFFLLFAFSGVGSGSTFRMIPVIFRTVWCRRAWSGEVTKEIASRQATIQSAAVIGFTSAVGAYGGFLIPHAFGVSLVQVGSISGAIYAFIGFYLMCLGLTWWWYFRRGAAMPC